MCPGSKQKTNQTSTYKPTQQASQLYTGVINQAQQTAQTPYNPATQTTVAGFNPQQLQAFNNINASSGNYQPLLSQAGGFAQQAAGPITPEQIAAYQNPYTQQVIDATMADMNRNNAVQQSQLVGNQIAQNPYALGSNRTGVAQAELGKGQNLNMANTIANLRGQGFTQALGAAQNDATRQLQASGQLGNLAGMTQNLSMTDLMAQLGIGNQQQQQQQATNDAASQNAQQQTMWPYQNTQWLASIASALGPLTGGTTSGQSTTSSGKGIGSMIGAGLSLASMMSDRRAKEGVHQIGQTFDGQPIYKFRYIGSPKTQIGLMAQDVEHSRPDAVSSGPAGLKMVDYDRATEGAEMATGGGVGFGGSSYFPWAELKPASANMPSLGAAPSAGGGGGGEGGFDPRKYMQMGKDARSGMESLFRTLDPAKGWGASIEPAGSSGGFSGLSSLLGGLFAAGGGVNWEDAFPFINPHTGRIIPQKDEDIGQIGDNPYGTAIPEDGGPAIAMQGPDEAMRGEPAGPVAGFDTSAIRQMMEAAGPSIDAEGAAQPTPREAMGDTVGTEGVGGNSMQVATEGKPRSWQDDRTSVVLADWLKKMMAPKDEHAKLSFDGGGFGLYGRPPAAPPPEEKKPHYGGPGLSIGHDNLFDMIRKQLNPKDEHAKLSFDGGGFGLYGRPQMGRAGMEDSEASSDLTTGEADVPNNGGFDGAPPMGWGSATETQGASPGLSTTDFIKQEEGWHDRTKKDGTQYTNGWGTRANDPNEVIDRAEADRRLDREIGEVNTWLDRNVKVPLSPSQRTGLASFGFNLGTGALQRILPDINKGDWQRVGDRMLSHNKVRNEKTGELEEKLTARRTREVALVRNQADPFERSTDGGGTPAPGRGMGSDSSGAGGLAAKGKDPEALQVSRYSNAADKAGGGLLKRGFGVECDPIRLTEDERMAMLQAGLGMMATGNVGAGGLQGMQYLRDREATAYARNLDDRKMALELYKIDAALQGKENALDKMTDNQKEHAAAVESGEFQGSLLDFIKEKKARENASANQLPGELAARVGLAKKFMSDLPSILTASDAMTLKDRANLVAGRGNAAQLWRRIESGIEAMRRMQTGAGMSGSESANFIQRYQITATDGKATRRQKLQLLRDDLNAGVEGALAGKSGEMVKEWRNSLGTPQAPATTDSSIPPKPEGMDDEQIYAEAGKELRSGKKDPATIRKWLEAWGLDSTRVQ